MDFDSVPFGSNSPEVSELLDNLVPPKRFQSMELDSYVPNPEFPSQLHAKETISAFVAMVRSKVDRDRRVTRPRGLFLKRDRVSDATSATGLYLDGGFGVGKTHLLVGAYRSFPYTKAYTSFSELTNFVGALGFHRARAALSVVDLLCIDEFELDDPGDTVLISNLCSTLTQEGVHLVVTSNTLPDRLGDGRFASEDFLREIQGLAAIFDVVKVDGPDFRHREFNVDELKEISSKSAISSLGNESSWLVIEFAEVMRILLEFHPVTYTKRFAMYAGVVITKGMPFDDQARGLRFVSFIDKVYEMEIPLVLCDQLIVNLFPESFLAGGFRQKYGRCLSRLYSLNLDFERKMKSD